MEPEKRSPYFGTRSMREIEMSYQVPLVRAAGLKEITSLSDPMVRVGLLTEIMVSFWFLISMPS